MPHPLTSQGPDQVGFLPKVDRKPHCLKGTAPTPHTTNCQGQHA